MAKQSERTHIVKRDNGWAVKQEGAQRASKVYETKEKAVQSAQKDKNSGRDLVIHKRDGSIQKWEKGR